ncbi:hypothetical protein FRACYDRAFT_188183, partial [Fragilariopsis cylindrus CCMP1102]
MLLSSTTLPSSPYTSFHQRKRCNSYYNSGAGNNNNHHNNCFLLFGAKGGGNGDKSSRKKKTTSTPSAAPSTSSPQPQPQQGPPRVTTNSNVSIRRQIAYGKINKQYREATSGSSFRASSIKRTSYRKVLDEETIQQKAIERQKKGQNPDWSLILNQTKADPLVLVDGYNVIHKWSRLKKQMNKGDIQHARKLLLDDLENLASLRRWRIECVFDGGGRGTISAGPFGGPAAADLSTNPTMEPFGNTGTVRSVYTGRGIEADTYIEGRCYAAKNQTLGHLTSSLIVATDDSQIKLVANSAGALCMSSDRFILELKAIKKGMQYRVEKAVSQINNQPMRPEKLWGRS